MTKYLGILLAVAMAAPAFAVTKRNAARNQDGQASTSPQAMGYSYTYKSDAAESMVCTGKCLLAGIIRSTSPGPDVLLTLRDTDSAAGSSTQSIPAITFGADTRAHDFVPLWAVSDNGWSAQLSSVAGGESVTFLYYDLDDE